MSRFGIIVTDRRIVLGALALLVMGGVAAAAVLPGTGSPGPAAATLTTVTTTMADPPVTSVPAAPVTSTTGATTASNDCTHPNHKTSAHSGGASYGSYVVVNDMWNPLSVKQTLYTCNYDSWYVQATMTSQGGAVQTYPNSQTTFAKRPKLGSLTSLSSSFAESSKPSGRGYDYEYAYDIWINGYGGARSSELMIWNYNNGQSPGGNLVGRVTVGGRQYDAYLSGSASGGDYIAFVATSNFTSGTFDLLEFFHQAISKGWVHGGESAKLWQVDYGVEICSTAGHQATFGVTNFDVSPVYAASTTT